MSVVRDFCGHGVGKLHSAPNVLHFGEKNTGSILEPGMFFTIEPMVNLENLIPRYYQIIGQLLQKINRCHSI